MSPHSSVRPHANLKLLISGDETKKIESAERGRTYVHSLDPSMQWSSNTHIPEQCLRHDKCQHGDKDLEHIWTDL